MPVGGSNSLWTRTLDRKTRAGFPECVVSSVRASAEDNTGQNTDTLNPRTEIKIPDLPGIEPGPPRRVGRQGLYRPCHGDATD